MRVNTGGPIAHEHSLRSGRTPMPSVGKPTSPPGPASVVPYLKRLDIPQESPPHQQRRPLLTLRLSSATFLDSVVHDGYSEQPLYRINTTGHSTAIMRRSRSRHSTRVADIRWPKDSRTKPGWDEVLVRMAGTQWKASESLLKSASLTSTRKFHFPNFPHSLKWKSVGHTFQCTTAIVKGPIAVLEPAGSAPPQLEVFVTIRDKTDPLTPMSSHHGISVLLLDYLIVTSLLLVTEAHEWTNFDPMPKSAHSNGSFASSPGKWSKNGDLLPKRSMPFISKASPPSSPLISPQQPSNTVRDGSLHPKLHSNRRSLPVSPEGSSSSPTSSEISQETIWEEMTSLVPWEISSASRMPPSPATESIYPRTPSSIKAPSHDYFDPTFYKDNAPLVPAMPQTCQPPSSASSTPGSTISVNVPTKRRRVLPLTPMDPLHLGSPDFKPLAYQLSASPPSSQTSPEIMDGMTQSSFPESSTPLTRQSRSNSVTSSSGGLRRLPQPPSQDGRPSTSPQNDAWPPPVPTPHKPASPFSPRLLPLPPLATSSSTDPPSPPRPPRTRSLEKEAEDVRDWVQNLTRSPAPKAGEVVFDIPPPAYNSIRFTVRPRGQTST